MLSRVKLLSEKERHFFQVQLKGHDNTTTDDQRSRLATGNRRPVTGDRRPPIHHYLTVQVNPTTNTNNSRSRLTWSARSHRTEGFRIFFSICCFRGIFVSRFWGRHRTMFGLRSLFLSMRSERDGARKQRSRSTD